MHRSGAQAYGYGPETSAELCEFSNGILLGYRGPSSAPNPSPPAQPVSLYRLLANGAEPAEVPSINGAEYKQNKAFISQAAVSLLIYFTVHRLYVCARVFSAGVICSSE